MGDPMDRVEWMGTFLGLGMSRERELEEFMIAIGESQWVVWYVDMRDCERHPSFLDSKPHLGGDLLLIFGTTSLWMGGTSFPSSCLYKLSFKDKL